MVTVRYTQITKENFDRLNIGDMVSNINGRATYNIINDNAIISVRNNIVSTITPKKDFSRFNLFSHLYDINHNRLSLSIIRGW